MKLPPRVCKSMRFCAARRPSLKRHWFRALCNCMNSTSRRPINDHDGQRLPIAVVARGYWRLSQSLILIDRISASLYRLNIGKGP